MYPASFVIASSFHVPLALCFGSCFILYLLLQPAAAMYLWPSGLAAASSCTFYYSQQLLCIFGSPVWQLLYLAPFVAASSCCVSLALWFGSCFTWHPLLQPAAAMYLWPSFLTAALPGILCCSQQLPCIFAPLFQQLLSPSCLEWAAAAVSNTHQYMGSSCTVNHMFLPLEQLLQLTCI